MLPLSSIDHTAQVKEDSVSQHETPQEPHWQPSSQVFMVGTMIDGMLAAAQENYASLQEARPKPHVLDDATVGRVVEVYTAQRDDLWLYDEQLRRSAAEPLKTMRRREVERLQGQMVALHTVLDALLVLVGELTQGTIERVLEADDAELGLAFLRRHLDRDAPAEPDA